MAQKSSLTRVKKILNLPSVKLPITPLTVKDIDQDIQRRVSRISREFTTGFNFIKHYTKSVTFFGSARLTENSPYYIKASRLAERLALSGYSILTGGGPGIMEAANYGAFHAGGESLGLTIKLPEEQVVNPYVSKYCEFYYFFTRKVCLTFAAKAYIYFPGGYGTLDEFFEILTLVQTRKIQKVPIILVGKEFWRPIHQYFNNYLYQKFKTISKKDMDLYHILDDEREIVRLIKRASAKKTYK